MTEPSVRQKTVDRQAPITKWLVGSDGLSDDPTSDCTSQSLLIGYSTVLAKTVFIQVTCKRWGCKFCGQQKVRKLASITSTAKPTKLITLTVDTKLWPTPRAAFDGTRRKLCDLHRKIRKRNGEFEYLRVLELTKAGWPHYHYVARTDYIPQRLLSTWWSEMTGAVIVDVRKIRQTSEAYWYVVKYLGKQTHCPWTTRRAVLSKGFDLDPTKGKKDALGLIGTEHIHESLNDYAYYNFPGQTLERIGMLCWTHTTV